MPPINPSQRLIARVTREDASRTPVSDGTEVITMAEAGSVARALLRSSFDTASNRRTAAAQLLGTPSAFESLPAYHAFAASMDEGRLARFPQPTNLVVAGESGDYAWPVSVRIAGETVEVGEAISPTAERPPVRVVDRRFICYPVYGRLGGDENHGMAIAVFDAVTRTTRIIAEEYYPISALRTVAGPGGRNYLIVGMSDQSDFGSRSAVVDVQRGIVASFAGTAAATPTGIAVRRLDQETGELTRETLTWDALADAEVITHEPDESTPNGALSISALLSSFGVAGWVPTGPSGIPESMSSAVQAELQAIDAYSASEPHRVADLDFFFTLQTDALGNTHEAYAMQTTLGESRTVTFFDSAGRIIAVTSAGPTP
jgi:hypothetical protein